MNGHVNITREDWVKSEYGFDTPAVTILIPRRMGIEYLRNVREPNDVCRVITALIEEKFPILKGCVVCSFSLDRLQDMWSCYVVHNSLKRVPLGQSAPIIRMQQDNEQVIPMLGECYELPIREDYTDNVTPFTLVDLTDKPEIVITRSIAPNTE